MLVFPNCKINLGLNIVSRRSDGYHNLETVFYPVALTDVLEAVKAPEAGGFSFSSTGLPVSGPSADNLCVKAFQLLKADFPVLDAVHLHLHKVIPSGAGLGGGSADAAFTLLLLNTRFQLGLAVTQLLDYAAMLGSDCPFFIINKPCFATGRGEILQQVPLDLSAYRLVLVNPGIHIHTGRAFSQITPALPRIPVQELIQQPVHTWKDALQNDFEKPVFAAHPEIAAVKETLYRNGAVYASMSGSGSTVYGLFEKNTSIRLEFPPAYFVKDLPLSAQ